MEQGKLIRNEYYKAVIPMNLIVLAVLAVITVIAWSTGNTVFETVSCMLIGAIGLPVLCAIITALITGAVIAKGRYEISEGTITRYQLWTHRRLTYLYAVFDNGEWCNVWANRIYRSGTRIYHVSIGNKDNGGQAIMVKADAIDG